MFRSIIDFSDDFSQFATAVVVIGIALAVTAPIWMPMVFVMGVCKIKAKLHGLTPANNVE